MRGPRIWFDPPLLRWPRVLVIALIFAAGVVVWLTEQRGLWREAPAVTVAGALAPRDPSASAVPTRRGPESPVRVAVTPVRRSVSPQAASTVRPVSEGEVEVCGVGLVKTNPVGATSAPGAVDDPLVAHRVPAARRAWLEAMQGSADVRTRAAALLLAATEGESLVPAQGSPAARARDELAHLAVDSRDPVVYAWAMSQCMDRPGAAGGTCQTLSHAQWTAIDPDNAWPWLRWMEAGGVDPAEALFRAGQARQLQSHWAALHPLVMAVQPPGMPGLERLMMSHQAAAVQRSVVGVNLPACSVAALRVVGRRQACETVADMLLQRGETFVDLSLGRGLGKRLGWSPDRLAVLDEEHRALQVVGAERVARAEDLDCAAIDARVDYFSTISRIGEIGTMREALRLSGQSIAELAQRHRERFAAASAPR